MMKLITFSHHNTVKFLDLYVWDRKHNYVNVPFQRETNSSVNRSECDSGIYSYVIVNRRTSYDSNFLQSTNGSLELPVVIAADPCGIVTNRRSATDNSDYYS